MLITISNCNNINSGKIEIRPKFLNVKYGINGTGKSTIAKSIRAFVEKKDELIESLKPYGSDDSVKPMVGGLNSFRNVYTFNEDFVNQFVYKEDDLLENSFEIFVKNPKYEANVSHIKKMLHGISSLFVESSTLSTLMQNLNKFAEGCGNSQNSISAASAIYKGFNYINKINNVPSDLKIFSSFLEDSKDGNNVFWLKWHMDGQKFFKDSCQCPFCSTNVSKRKDKIIKISKEYKSKDVEHVNELLKLLEYLDPYLSQSAKTQIAAIKSNSANITILQKKNLFEIKQEAELLLTLLNKIKDLPIDICLNVTEIDNVVDIIQSLTIDALQLNYFKSLKTERDLKGVNQSLRTVFTKARELQGIINSQKKALVKNIQDNGEKINTFLKCAGYKYSVYIGKNDRGEYKTILKSTSDVFVSNAKTQLSYGERNALALALFLYSFRQKKMDVSRDLIVLDDPISSFDGNKKFALLHALFLQEEDSFRGRTVLLLTHEFNTVVDVMSSLKHKFTFAEASFLSTENNILTEKEIRKDDIVSFNQICLSALKSKINSLNKLIYLRRLLEVLDGKEDAWNLLSNILHKRQVPVTLDNVPMTSQAKKKALKRIRVFFKTFDYNKEYGKTQSKKIMVRIYSECKSNYEKLQIYRIICSDNHDNGVVKKFVNETYHVENDLLFQLDPRKYQTIPQYIIDECDRDLITKGYNIPIK